MIERKEKNMKSNIFKRPVTIKERIKSAGQTNGTAIGTIGTLTAKEVLDVDTTISATAISVAGTTLNLTAEIVELAAKGISTGLEQAHQWLDEVNLQLEADAQKAQDFAVKRQREAELRTEVKLKELDINSFQNTVSLIQRHIELGIPYDRFIQKIVQIYEMDKVNVESLEMLHHLINIYAKEGIDTTYLTSLYQSIQQQLP